MSVLRQDADTRTERLALENKLRLETTQPWATAPRALMLAGGARTFEVEVDPTALPEGLHYAEVYGTDTAAPQRGALFRQACTPECGISSQDICALLAWYAHRAPAEQDTDHGRQAAHG